MPIPQKKKQQPKKKQQQNSNQSNKANQPKNAPKDKPKPKTKPKEEGKVVEEKKEEEVTPSNSPQQIMRGIQLVSKEEYLKKGQTFPPSKVVSTMYENDAFPTGEILLHPVNGQSFR
ncbi:hypothetical protein RFI_04344 [Reticulomyxa filosa]|uniref:Uncharacterized protein n=1 Tax=Reticulomyxa filosa TaxID=46433 RepID=X6P3I8_RETFI|nr:hypothetical protein RFI_04344 [Reticulomyxa filosa]|eukprot:ETO32771.1 hypothetical protein RFI_04344 [Reticulomyxa filosa]